MYYPLSHTGPSLITIRYDSVYLTCSKKLTGSQLSLPYGMNKMVKEKKLKKTKNKLMSMVSLVQSHYHEGSSMGKKVKLRWEGFFEKVWSEGVMRVAMMSKMA